MHMIKEIARKHSVIPGACLSLDEYSAFIAEVGKTYGEESKAKVMDCFTPTGGSVEEGYEDSCEHYILDVSWEELCECVR